MANGASGEICGVTFRIDEVQEFEQWAFVRVTFDGHLRPKPGRDLERKRVLSRHLMILKRNTEGIWQLTRDVWINPPG